MSCCYAYTLKILSLPTGASPPHINVDLAHGGLGGIWYTLTGIDPVNARLLMAEERVEVLDEDEEGEHLDGTEVYTGEDYDYEYNENGDEDGDQDEDDDDVDPDYAPVFDVSSADESRIYGETLPGWSCSAPDDDNDTRILNDPAMYHFHDDWGDDTVRVEAKLSASGAYEVWGHSDNSVALATFKGLVDAAVRSCPALLGP
jgi:hypothetical protein